VGLTRYRDGLEPLRVFTAEECKAVIEQVEAFAKTCLEELGTRLVWCSDEMYIKAGLPIPDFDCYEEFEQMENGVGMIASFQRELEDLISFMDEPFTRPIRVSSVTGMITQDLIRNAVTRLQEKFTDLQCDVYAIRNDFFGPDVTVTGLITGQDIISQLKGKNLGDYLIVPEVMLRDGMFLDNISVRDVEAALDVKIRTAGCDPEGFAEALMRSARR
jgi:NifB/MoaA-like Fe-S oxidoreductase